MFFLSVLGCLFLFVSCNKKAEPEAARFRMVDMNWVETMDLKQVSLRPSKNCLHIYAWIGRTSYIDPKIYAYTFLDTKKTIEVSAAEKFASEKIVERIKDAENYYLSNFASITLNPHVITTVYMKERIMVYADKTLFGKDPGADLSSFFKFTGGTTLFKMTGPDYNIIDEGNGDIQNCPLAEYFSIGTIVPDMYFIQSTAIPEELNKDKNITLTFVFPVIIEHYWRWLLELYDNPEAEESFTELDMTLKVCLNDMKNWDPQ